LSELGPTGRLLALDADPTAVAAFTAPSDTKASYITVVANFRDLPTVLAAHQCVPDAIVADLGWRSEQFENGGRGFSFTADEPLQMTYGPPEQYHTTAYEVVNEWAEASLTDIIKGYGEERFARRIAAAIGAARSAAPITTARALADIITAAVPARYRTGRIHPATKTFQAIRMAVNDELGALSTLLESAVPLLAPGGQLAIISFHSLEDRLVKRAFKNFAHDQLGLVRTKKPLIAREAEVADNPRARSAKLRVFQKHHESPT
jgi:16S rRNA (cytosine1402-N4)-methyltransferase